ncbi:hypothetical protein D4R87_01575 [bacterium]|nr:MAG: hypothetical protein D4R87_01575 [bacterium]
MEIKISIYVNAKKDSFQIPSGTKLIPLSDIFGEDIKDIAKQAGVELEILKCPDDEICKKYCALEPDIMIVNKELQTCLVICLRDITELFLQVNGLSSERRDFADAIREKIKTDFYSMIANN